MVFKVTHEHISAESAGQRIDNYLMSKLKGLPKSRLYRLIRKGEIRVNKKRIKPDYRLNAGDDIRIPPISLSQPKTIKQDSGLFKGLMERVIYEDQHILAINKPHGIAVHGGTHSSYGVVECLRLGLNKPKLELIHRIDKATSGCLLLAKSRQALKFYHQIFRERELDKHYRAIVHGHWPRSIQKVDLPLLRTNDKPGEKKVIVSPEGQTAISYIKPETYYPGATLLNIKIITGRTHQIRVHTSAKQHPIIGDERYGTLKLDETLLKNKAKRMYLHAFSITVPNFDETDMLKIVAPLDDNWKQMLDMLSEN